MQPKISIIVPIYNASSFLGRCLTSILHQTFQDWECITIDDGSTDGSNLICDSFADVDSRFKSLRKNNGGVSSARNLGINHAVGQWILFVDADDVLINDSLETLTSLTNDEIDCVIGGYVTADEKGNILSSSEEIIKETVDWEKLPLHFYYPFHGKFYGYLWNRLMRLEIIKKHNITFREDIHIKEDGLFGVQFVCASKRRGIYYTKPVYQYTINMKGAMKTLENKYDPKYLTDLDACINIYNTIKQSGCKNKKTLFYAKMYVCTMLDNTLHYMHKYKVSDENLEKIMRDNTINCVSYPFYFMMQLKKTIKRMKEK